MSQETRLETMIESLRENGHRITPQRIAILSALAESPAHPTVEEVHAEILKDFPTTSLATVYKTISLLKREGQVLELEFSDLSNRYDGRRPSPHPHVICTRCGAVAEPELAELVDLPEDVSRRTGFEVRSHRIDFYGLCPACRK